MVSTKESSPPRQWSSFGTELHQFISRSLDRSENDERIECLDRLWDDAEKLEILELYGGKKQKGVTNTGIKQLLAAFEGEKTEYNLFTLCRILETVIEMSGSEGEQKKEKMILKADPLNILLRETRKRLLVRLEDSKPLMDDRIDDLLFKLIYNIGLKDKRFNWKSRMSGLIVVMTRYYIKFDGIHESFYLLFIKISRNPRNGKIIGKYDGLMTKLYHKIALLNKENNVKQIMLLDKNLQLLYFTLKNKKTRIQMIREPSFCRVLVDILRKHLSSTSQSKPTKFLSSVFGTCRDDSSTIDAHYEVVYGSLAILRLLANNKRAKDDIISLGIIDICAKELNDVSDAPKKEINLKIEESLCALSLRCMSTVAYPLDNIHFPLGFALPQPSVLPGGRVRNTSSINVSFDNGKSSDDEANDDYDDTFNDHNVSSNFEMSDDDEAMNEKTIPSLPKTTKLMPAQLNKYSQFFIEMEKGTLYQTENRSKNTNEESWKHFCDKTKYVMPIREMLPYEMFSVNTHCKERLGESVSIIRQIIAEKLEKSSNHKLFSSPKVVFDLDSVIFDTGNGEVLSPQYGKIYDPNKELIFESRFESGNLRRATQISPTHYELVLSPDINQLSEHYQWFFFQVSNMKKDVNYTFEIINCLKSSSMYSEGMQPVMFSTLNASSGWKRAGHNICYYRNLYTVDSGSLDEKNGEDKKKRIFYSIRFDITFPDTNDICYLAYHYPYTYSTLNANLYSLRKAQLTAVYEREDVIGHSLAGNPIKMLTITSPGSSEDVSSKPVVIVSARVHPGESNSSWVMQGLLEALLCGTSTEMYRLREQFVFKIIPMLNPDGVINGSHRCSLAGIDLNRVWDRPNESLHPEIFHSKAIFQYLCETIGKKPFVFVDLHGHSKKWDCFLFGNNAAESWRKEDINEGYDEEEHLSLPKAMDQVCADKFNLSECKFSITRAKESSARVNIWRQFGVSTAYTLESTYCGFRMEPNNGYQISIDDLKQIGTDLLYSFLEMANK